MTFEYIVTLYGHCDDDDFISYDDENDLSMTDLCCQVVAYKMGAFDLPKHYHFMEKKYSRCYDSNKAVFRRVQKNE